MTTDWTRPCAKCLCRPACSTGCGASPWPTTRTSTTPSATCPCPPALQNVSRASPGPTTTAWTRPCAMCRSPPGCRHRGSGGSRGSSGWSGRSRWRRPPPLLLAVAGLYFGSKIADLVATSGTTDGSSHRPVTSTPAETVQGSRPEGHKLTTSIASEEPARSAASWPADVPKIDLSPSDRDLARGNPSDPGGLTVPSGVDPLGEIDLGRPRHGQTARVGQVCRRGWFRAAWIGRRGRGRTTPS